MARLRIEGGHPIHGTFVPRGNKNAVLPMLAACLLTDQPITLENIPLIKDVMVMLELLEALGVHIEQNDHTLTLHAATIKQTELDAELCARVRTSILMAGPQNCVFTTDPRNWHSRPMLMIHAGFGNGLRKVWDLDGFGGFAGGFGDGCRRVGVRACGSRGFAFPLPSQLGLGVDVGFGDVAMLCCCPLY